MKEKITSTIGCILILLLISCDSKTSKQNIILEKQMIENKNYPKTNNYPEADITDSAMENDFVRAANAYENKELTAQNAIITSRDWVVYKDYNGKPVKRNRIAVITTKIENRCFLQHLSFQQDINGSDYGETYVSDVYGWKEFDCSLKD